MPGYHRPVERADDLPAISPYPLLAIGAVSGLFAAIFGIGGGIVIVPLLMLVTRMPPRIAAVVAALDFGNARPPVDVERRFGMDGSAHEHRGEPLVDVVDLETVPRTGARGAGSGRASIMSV